MEMNLVSEPEMSMDEFTMIRDFIHEKSGIFFGENKMYLVKNRIIKRMGELAIKNYRDYFYHVKYDTSLKEFNNLMNVITTNETSFYRNEPQLLSFSDEVLPLLIEEKMQRSGPKHMRIWSAGCSTGEEPYTLAMILSERLRGLAGWNIEIIANDISESVLQRARRGEYNGITLRGVKPHILAKYFTKVDDVYRVNPEIKAMVSFSHLNLNDTRKISLNSNFDAIFCRNVMIYFSDEVKKHLVRGFFNALRPGGYFYIGHSETLHGISKAFKLIYFKNALVYQKEAAGTQSTTERRSASTSTNTAGRAAVTSSSAASSGAARALDLLSKIKSPVANK